MFLEAEKTAQRRRSTENDGVERLPDTTKYGPDGYYAACRRRPRGGL
jgi:hypothetical protein